MLNKLEYTCSNCDEYYLIYESGDISPQKYAKLKEIIEQQVKLGYCKKCHRKDPDVPTTFEMDGLVTKEDIQTRNDVVFQCKDCKKWTLHSHYTGTHTPCSNCGSINYDPTSLKSFRTYNAVVDNKRKVKK